MSRNHINNIIVFHATVSPLPPLLLLQLPLLLQLLLLLLLANYHHCEDHTITQTARYPSVHPTKQTSWQTSTAAEITPGPVITPRPASKTSEMLNTSENPQTRRRRLDWHRWRWISAPPQFRGGENKPIQDPVLQYCRKLDAGMHERVAPTLLAMSC